MFCYYFLNKNAKRDCLMNTAGDEYINCKQAHRCTCNAPTCTAPSHILNIHQQTAKSR